MPVSIAHYKEPFLTYLGQVRGASPLTVKTYEIALRQMLQLCHVEEQRLYLMPFRKAIATQNKKTITKKLSAVRTFVDYLNEIESLKIILRDDTPIKVPKSLPKPIEHHHIMEALSHANPQEYLIILLLYGMGLRISELSHIKLDAIKPRWIRVTGKGNKMRDVPITAQIFDAIAHYRSLYAPRAFLFEDEEGKLSEDSLRYKLVKAFERVAIKATPHQLRHAYATQLLNSGAKIEAISELMGHESIATTQIYTQLASKQKMATYQQAHPLMTLSPKE
ncbi:MAG: hypothetical protein KU28_01595 [Sulfurovum sp. PC08-66]|nr:MAG: hypothetical protein KU28_01595 [Sulfurovum sp. PC08-66]KIM12634.1 MAG: hypothetical protein KU37_01710 [Sulfuricurvum sp. PC08-66]